jgi:hypothetical protein
MKKEAYPFAAWHSPAGENAGKLRTSLFAD